MSGEEWGWGLLVVEQRGQHFSAMLGGWINDEPGPFLVTACRYLDGQVRRLHGALDPDRVWSFQPGVDAAP